MLAELTAVRTSPVLCALSCLMPSDENTPLSISSTGRRTRDEGPQPDALHLGPRKKACVLFISFIFLF